MITAFVLMQVELGREDRILNELIKNKFVKEGYIVTGVYDIIVKLKVNSREELKEIVINKLRTIEGVKSTQTVVAFEEITK